MIAERSSDLIDLESNADTIAERSSDPTDGPKIRLGSQGHRRPRFAQHAINVRRISTSSRSSRPNRLRSFRDQKQKNYHAASG